jgi:3-hydroxyisobutyrate dehydrogenase-like beta-hydroxyacid dehydrogenase
VGNGANMKLVVNMMMGSFMASCAEGLSLAQAVGLKQQDLIDVVALGTIATPMFALKVCNEHLCCLCNDPVLFTCPAAPRPL